MAGVLRDGDGGVLGSSDGVPLLGLREGRLVNPVGGSGDPGRDGWCTPKWLAELIGPVDIDPCSNGRSHIQASWTYSEEAGTDGLQRHTRPTINEGATVYVNPPYSRGQVIRWVRHWRTTRFIFLCRWDPSTAWFNLLFYSSTHVWFPTRRINFEPPPGVASSSNPFPHALFMRDPDPALLARLDLEGYLLPVDKGPA